MPQDKTIVVIPTIAFTQVVPNITNAVANLAYNEGIYLFNNSFEATYPKSVVRVYKNPNLPKKIYLLSKDTSFYDAVSKAYNSFDETVITNEIVLSSGPLQEFLSYELDNIGKYTRFEQPNNFLNLDIDTLKNKKINFYTLSTSSVQTLSNNLKGNSVTGIGIWRSDPNLASTIDNTIYYSYLLKSKSTISDYYNDSTNYTEQQTDLFNNIIYYYWPQSGSISKVGSLSETDLSLFYSGSISKTRAIDFSTYVNKKYEGLWLQKIDSELSNTGGSDIRNNYVFLYPNNSDGEANYQSLLRYDNLGESEELVSMVGNVCLLTKNDFILKNLYKNREGFVAYDVNDRDDSDTPYGQVLRSDTGTYSADSALKRRKINMFEQEYVIDFHTYGLDSLTISDISQRNPFIYFEEDRYREDQRNLLDLSNDLSTLYVFDESFKDVRANFGFIPDDPYTKVYELELEEELDIENGSYFVVEIE